MDSQSTVDPQSTVEPRSTKPAGANYLEKPIRLDPNQESQVILYSSSVADSDADTADLDSTTDVDMPTKACKKCNQPKPLAEFISKKTNRPILTCRECMAPKLPTTRENALKRKVSRKAADNVAIEEEVEGRRLTKKARVEKGRVQRQAKKMARDKVEKLLGSTAE